MSFSSRVKSELAHAECEKECCRLAEIAGFIRMCGSIRLKGAGEMELLLYTESPAIARHFKMLIKDRFGLESAIEVGRGEAPRKKKRYVVMPAYGDGAAIEEVLRECGILIRADGTEYLGDGIYEALVKNRCCKKAYLRGAFLGAGSISDPEKSYHLEFICSSGNLSADLKKLINSFEGIRARVSERQGSFVVYIKDAEQIGDMLNIMKAHKAFFEHEDVRLKREVINRTNRIYNCDSANSDKIVDAAQRQLGAIRKIEEKRGLNSLPEKLREAALLRIENPSLGLEELSELFKPKLSKSGVNGRLRKLEQIAEQL